jgi:cellobiose phosphorylase
VARTGWTRSRTRFPTTGCGWYTTLAYINATGDESLLDETVMLSGRPLNLTTRNLRSSVTGDAGSYATIAFAPSTYLSSGAPACRWWAAAWNDGMNLVGASAARCLARLVHRVAAAFVLDLPNVRRRERAEYRRFAAALVPALTAHGTVTGIGEPNRRRYRSARRRTPSANRRDCVMVGDLGRVIERTVLAMNAVKVSVRRDDRLVLLAPPFDADAKSGLYPGLSSRCARKRRPIHHAAL